MVQAPSNIIIEHCVSYTACIPWTRRMAAWKTGRRSYDGVYTIRARAVDNDGAATDSSTIQVTLHP